MKVNSAEYNSWQKAFFDEIFDKKNLEFTEKEGTSLELLHNNDIECSIQFLSDIPVQLPESIAICGTLERSSANHLIVIPSSNQSIKTLNNFSEEDVIHSSSSIINAQLKAVKASLNFNKIKDNSEVSRAIIEQDGIGVLPEAHWNLIKPENDSFVTIKINAREFPGIPGTGIIACLCHKHNVELRRHLKTFHKREIALASNIERSLLLDPKLNKDDLGIFVNLDQNMNYHVTAYYNKIDQIKRISFSQSTKLNLLERITDELY